MVDPSFLNTGFSFARSAKVAPGRIPSSTEIVTGVSSPVFGSTTFSPKKKHLNQKKIKYNTMGFGRKGRKMFLP